LLNSRSTAALPEKVPIVVRERHLSDMPPVLSPSRSFWLSSLAPAQHASLNSRSTAALPEKVPIVVLGAGMSGVSVAYHLAQRGRGADTLLLDARCVAGGASGRNGGQIKPISVWELGGVARQHGVLRALQLWRHEAQNRHAIRRLVDRHAIDCDLERDIDCVQLYPGTAAGLRAWREKAWPAADSALVQWALSLVGGPRVWDADACASELALRGGEGGGGGGGGGGDPASNTIGAGLALLDGAADTFSCAKFCAGLVDEARRAGVNVQPHTRVLRIERACDDNGGEIRVVTDRGTVRCERVVHCTNAWSAELLPQPFTQQIKPIRNHLISSAPAPPLRRPTTAPSSGGAAFGLHPGFSYWMQRRQDGRVVLGGFRNEVPGNEVGVRDDSEAGMSEDVLRVAKRFLRDVGFVGFAGGEVAIEHAWSGIIGWSCDNLPFVGPVPARPREYVCAGFSGHGMTQTLLCGAAAADMVVGAQPSPQHCFMDAFLPDSARTGAPWDAGSPH
jgi:glycine/D-amino acid oxidase-like deaminating enzyme